MTAILHLANSTSPDHAANGIDDIQLAHLRHIENLAAQPDGDWSHMGNADPGQEWLDSYRYQLAKATYALGLAHFHRLPAAPCAVKPVYEGLMRKMLRRDVWGYWKDTSQSGKQINPDLHALRTPWVDPVIKENIMYSGHLHAMAGMYAVLFNDDRYAQAGALTFTQAPIFWGMGPDSYEYDFKKLNDVIYWQMVESGWLGVACEPNCVFLICNQFPLLGFRFHDLRYGTTIATEATAAYKDAWNKKGMLDSDGHFHTFWLAQQDMLIAEGAPMKDAWLGAVMHAWNPDYVRAQYPRQSSAWLKRGNDGLVSLHAPTVVKAARQAALGRTAPVLTEDRSFTWNSPEFGYAAIWASEIGDQETLQGLLKHADRHMAPTVHRGGLYYPRNDRSWDEDGNMVYVDPLTGNSLLAYARLNVPDGLRRLYEQPFTKQHFAKPALIDMAPRVDITRAYCNDNGELHLSLRSRSDVPRDTRLTVSNVRHGQAWTLLRDGAVIATQRDPAPAGWAIEQRDDTLVLTCTIGSLTDLCLRLA